MSNSKLKQDLIKLLGKEKVLSQDLDLFQRSYRAVFIQANLAQQAQLTIFLVY
jgi:hypothetical protein